MGAANKALLTLAKWCPTRAFGFQHWFWFPIFGWGIGLTFHFLEVNNYNIFLGKNWEDRKIKEMMKDDKNNKYN